MIAAFDVLYAPDPLCEGGEIAQVAGIRFETWGSEQILEEVVFRAFITEPYVPGEFYRRELPLILECLSKFTTRPDILVVDGYVDLGSGKAGLGRKLHEATNLPVVGVAKKSFLGSEGVTLLRGESKKPLFITNAKLPGASSCISSMAGEFRIPKMLKHVDFLSRQGFPPELKP